MPGVVTPVQPIAELFKTMGHPARVMILEILATGEQMVADLIPSVGLEPSHLSQQLGILRRAGLVTSRRDGVAVIYELADPRIADLVVLARDVLVEHATATRAQLVG